VTVTSGAKAMRLAILVLVAGWCCLTGRVGAAIPEGTTEPSPVSERLPRPSLFPYYQLQVGSEALSPERPTVSFFLFSRDGAPRLRLHLIDEKQSLQGLAVSLNGRDVGVLDRGGLVAAGGERGGFDGTFTPWVVFRAGGRRGLTRFVLTPRYSTGDDKRFHRRFVDWCGEIFFQKAVLVEPVQMFKGLRDMAAVEEEVYYFLRRFDEVLRGVPRCCVPAPFVRDARRLPDAIRRTVASLRSREFLKLSDDFYYIAYGKRLQTWDYFEATISRLNDIQWIWHEPDVHPLAAYVYATNRQQVFLQPYLHDIVIAKRATKNAYLALCAEGAPMGDGELDALLKAQQDERDRISNLVEVTDVVGAACDAEADRLYARFPSWKTEFPMAFERRVRARFWPSGMYPVRDDLFRERVLLREYFRLVRLFARADLQQAKLRCRILEAVIRHPMQVPAVPGMRPFHPEDEP